MSDRFRSSYRQLSDKETFALVEIRARAEALELLIDNDVPRGRYHSLAMTALEQVVMWAVKGITE